MQQALVQHLPPGSVSLNSSFLGYEEDDKVSV